MPNLSKPPSLSDDGDYGEALESAQCRDCDAELTPDELDELNANAAFGETDEELEAGAQCSACWKKGNGDDDE